MWSGLKDSRPWRSWSRAFAGALIAVAVWVRPSLAQDPAEGWQFDVALSVGAFRIEGDRTIDVREPVVPFAAGFGESRLAWSGRLEVGRNGWRGVLDAGQVVVDERHVRPGDESARAIHFRLTRTDWLLSRRLGRGGPTGWVEGSVGIRYSRLKQEAFLEDDRLAEARQAATWVDPLIGFRYLLAPYQRVGFLTTVELGGFGLGSAFSWGVRMGCLVRFTPGLASLIEYRLLDVDYQRRPGGVSGSFVYNGTSHGLVTTLLLHF